MRAHPSWQRPLSSSHLFFSLYARRLDDSYKLHLTSPLQGGNGSHLLDLLIIIEIHPIIISTERSSRTVEQRKRSRRKATPSRLLRRLLQPAPDGSPQTRLGPPDLQAETTLASYHQFQRRVEPSALTRNHESPWAEGLTGAGYKVRSRHNRSLRAQIYAGTRFTRQHARTTGQT
ncbi:hypothetical protein HU200_056816 [Digitaria exilis]|uniref:Uncharacterized protein n=1 Tax=Digitaria exilis TaxID=1010633 RepID=A0A835ACG2_9POAL|nr:hypothetical protein HU200_056816 [Digitaria exilis]